MKPINLALILGFSLGLLNLNGQAKSYYSAEVNANYYNFLSGEILSNNFSYGLSFVVSKKIDKLKLSTGLTYTFKCIDLYGSSFYSIDKYEHQIKYISIPIHGSIGLNTKKTIYPSILTGFSFHSIYDHKILIHSINGDVQTVDGNEENRNLGVSLLIGMKITKSLFPNCLVNLSSFVDWSLIPDYKNQRPDHLNIPEDRLFLGLSIGVEYILSKSE
ncbi:MAG: hypothetical protein KAR19_17150 [Bacteroidales bacterium]|nr:hypothetical protein [Bacteroidales bacterium]